MKLAAHKKKEQINLLPKSGFASTTSGRILTWLLSTFRVIVIVTEILVMVAFLSRFWLDAQNSDLNDQMRQKKSLISASLGFEEDLADVQKRIEVYAQYSIDSGIYTNILNYITTSLPPDVVLTELAVEKTELEIVGVSPNEESIQQLIANIETDERFTNVIIKDLFTDRSQSDLIVFEIIAKRNQ